MSTTDALLLITFLIEVVLLFRFEKQLWGTYFTPLNFLMIPYTLVLLITISLPESLGFVPFYYPSLIIWMVGLPVFAIPGMLLGWRYSRNSEISSPEFPAPVSLKPIYWLGGILLLLSMYYLRSQSQSSHDVIGSDEFAEATFQGVWGHIRIALLALLILFIYFFEKRTLLLYLFIAGITVISIVYQVKSWILIPIFAGIIMRLYTRKAQLKIKYFVFILLGSVASFFLSYYLILVFAEEDGELTLLIAEMIYKHFIHYLISGTVGLSVDMQQGILEQADISSIFAPFINVFQLFAGGNFVSPINPVYLDSGWTGTNVRTYFGTLYVHLGAVGASIYVFYFSLIMYAILYRLKRVGGVITLAIYGLMCALLTMGWFEFYFFHLIILEIPLVFLGVYFLLYKFVR